MRLHGTLVLILAFLLSVTAGTVAWSQDAAKDGVAPDKAAEPAAEKPAAEMPATAEKPVAVIEELKPAPAAEKPAEAKPAEPVIEELAPVKPAAEAPAAEEPVVAPAAEKPAERKPTAEEAKLDALLAPAATKPAEPVTNPVAESAPVPVPAQPVSTEEVLKRLGSPERSELARQMADMEVARRQAREMEGKVSIETADKAWKNDDYATALAQYQLALAKLPISTAMSARNRAAERIPECEYRVVLALVKEGKKPEALAKAKEFLERRPDNKALEQLRTRLTEEKPKDEEDAKKQAASEVRSEAEKQMFVGKQQMAERQFDRARASFESALAIEPENREAMRYLKELGDRKFVSSTVERNATAAKMTAQVRDTWNPQYKMIKGKVAEAEGPKPPPSGPNILTKMEKIIIPEIEFRQANIHDVVEFLNKASVEGDKESEQSQRGVNIILNLNPSGGAPASAPAAKPAGESLFEAPAGGGGGGGGQSYEITFTARYISLLSALKIITSVAGLKWRVDGNIVMIVPADYDPSEIEVRMYPVEPTFIERVREAGAAMPQADVTRGGREVTGLQAEGIGSVVPDLETYFKGMGMKFPKGSSITYNSAIGKVILANTAENLAIFEKILPELNVVPKQVEIEARFVEVNETDLQEMGLEWLLTDNWELAAKQGALGSSERIQMNANKAEGGFTKGLRFWGTGTDATADTMAEGKGTLGRLLSVSSVLTNPELTMVLHMLEQNGNADLLSAPKVTTRSGAEASIRVVTEFIYPTSFEVQGGTLQGAANNNSAQAIQETTVVPQDFATREVGVILTVLPEVSPDGNMINLTMTPQVVTEPTWYQYGSTVRRADGSTQTLNMPQPFFHVRSINTQISIYDGATVVMGGLITEDLRKVNDKIPVLGDIPLLGTLFRSKSDRSIKKNLLIFVTAKLVDPAGRLIRNPEAEAAVPMKPAATAAAPAAPK
jgi:general secretion pathway protein D